MNDDDLQEAKRLAQKAATVANNDIALANLTLAVNLLIGLVEGHRHSYVRIGEPGNLTGPMQAMEDRL